jgi:uncharacterized membrane protein YidH (DUF202 family)
MKGVTAILFLYSATIGSYAVYSFRKFIKENVRKHPEYAEWNTWCVITAVYIVVVAVVLIMLMMRA